MTASTSRANDRSGALVHPADAAGRRPPPAMLETRHLSRSIGQKVLVQDISIQVEAGEILAIVGPSGAGKSSFLRLLNRLDEPTGGTVLLKGQDYRSMAPQDLRRRVGMLLQTAYRREHRVRA